MTQQFLQLQPRAAESGGVGLKADAFAEIYAEHMPALTRYCRSILRDREDAEDAAQNAMERAMKALCDGPAPDRMAPWLFTIAQREALSLMRRRKRSAPAGEFDEAALGGTNSCEELSAVRERLAELLGDLRALSPRQREALVQRELGGHSYKEIAAAMDTSVALAQQTVLEARQSLTQFREGRSLECDDVQGWLSANDHARIRTRRVRAHLRGCACCDGFQTAIGARRRGFGLLLPGIGSGGALWSALAAALGGTTFKLAGAGALAITGAVLVAAPLPAPSPEPKSATRGTDLAVARHATPRSVPLVARLDRGGAAAGPRAVVRRSGSTSSSKPSSREHGPGAGAKAATPEPGVAASSPAPWPVSEPARAEVTEVDAVPVTPAPERVTEVDATPVTVPVDVPATVELVKTTVQEVVQPVVEPVVEPVGKLVGDVKAVADGLLAPR